MSLSLSEMKKDAVRMIKSSAGYRALLCSFGKDSMVLLHLVLEAIGKIPVVHFRLPYCPEKYAFANRVIEEYGLEVHYPPPSAIHFRDQGSAGVALLYSYVQDRGGALQMPMDAHASDRQICSLDMTMAPKGSMQWPWDLLLVGHKSSDTDLADGNIKLFCDRVSGGHLGSDCLFPLREWTDNDIWDYIERFKVPYDERRYALKDREEIEDKTMNSDYFPFCTQCVTPAGGPVHCPKHGVEVANISDRVQWANTADFGYFQQRSRT